MANLTRLRTIHRETLLLSPLTNCKSSIVILMIRMTLIHGKVGGLICSSKCHILIKYLDIFDDRTSSISRLFREIKVEHHLIQDDIEKRPDIPGLTPKGFETWATLMILANPGREYERLQKAVLNMPINNPDDKKERFPKEIPRSLFPEIGDIAIREDIEDRMMVHCGVDLPYITPEERNQSAARSTRSSTTTASPTERTHSYERGRPRPTASIPKPAQQPQSRPASTVTDDGEDEPIPSVPIERERKPYSANPGVGKVYEEQAQSRNHTGSFSTSRPSESTHKAPTGRRQIQHTACPTPMTATRTTHARDWVILLISGSRIRMTPAARH
jgi:hypothetical protein